MVLRQVPNHARIAEHLGQEALGEHQIEMVGPV